MYPSKDILKTNFANFIDIKDDPNACWNWKGTTTKDFIRFKVNSHPYDAKKMALWYFKRKKVPHKKWIHRTCSSTTCMNPNHFSLKSLIDVPLVKKKRTTKNRLYLQELKQASKCATCGFSDYRALLFHHRNPADKKYTVSQTTCMTWEKFMAEIEKCDILCANCHHILHYHKPDASILIE